MGKNKEMGRCNDSRGASNSREKKRNVNREKRGGCRKEFANENVTACIRES